MNTVIMRDSPEAASIQTVTGWVSSRGRYWGDDERMARFDGATHQKCEKNPAHAAYPVNAYCKECHKERIDSKWEALPKREYDGSPVCLFDGDEYFFEIDQIICWLEQNEIEPKDARLVFCKPNYPTQINPDEYYCDDLPEDGRVSATLYEAFETLNAIIKKELPMSWSPRDEAVLLTRDTEYTRSTT